MKEQPRPDRIDVCRHGARHECGEIASVGPFARREPGPGRYPRPDAVDTESTPVLPIEIPCDEIPPAARVHDALRLDRSIAAAPPAVPVSKAQALPTAARARERAPPPPHPRPAPPPG